MISSGINVEIQLLQRQRRAVSALNLLEFKVDFRISAR